MMTKRSVEKTVRDIKRHTRKKFPPRRESASFWKAFVVKILLRNSVAVKAHLCHSVKTFGCEQ